MMSTMSDGKCESVANVSGEFGDTLESCNVDYAEESVDPRVQVELERLNASTDLINKLEIELDEARSSFRLLLSESSQRVNHLAKKLGSCVEKARPYYEARMQAKQLQSQTQKAALRYERASSAHAAAKEMVYLAEEGLKKEGRCFDPAWQEMLNHATMRVNEAESERVLSEQEHQRTSSAYNEAEKRVQLLHQDLKRAIVKSSLSTRRSLLQLNNLANQHQLQLLPYFEMKAQFNQLLEDQRKKVHHLEENVLKVKMSYADALHNLEEISDEIHQKRKLQDQISSEKRSEGVGAESPDHVWNNYVRMTYHKMPKRSISTEDLFPDALTTDDTYMSLPSKLSPRAALLATGSLDSDTQGRHRKVGISQLPIIFHKYQFQNEVISNGSGNYAQKLPTSVNSEESVNRKGNSHDGDRELSLIEEKEKADTNYIANYIEQLNLSTEEELEMPNTKCSEIRDRSPEGAEMTDLKLQAQDLNMLRVQKEDISDSESLASNDTVDTLDDNQIECLLLDRVLAHDYQDILSLSDAGTSPTNNEITK